MHAEHLINRLRRRRGEQNAVNFDIWDFIHAEGSGLDALMYSKLFWPDFIEIDGMVFLQGHTISSKDTERLREVLREKNEDRTSTEKAFNHIEVAYLFGPRRGTLQMRKTSGSLSCSAKCGALVSEHFIPGGPLL